MSFIWLQWRKQHLPLPILILLCLNVVTAPVVYAVANSTLERPAGWAKELKIKIKGEFRIQNSEFTIQF